MIVRRILCNLKSATSCVCKSSNCEFNITKTFFIWRQTMKPVLGLNIARITNAELVRHYARNIDKPKSQGKQAHHKGGVSSCS